jgi:Bacteriophage tail sheath protein
MQPKTPDVYVREKSILPPSVAEVATAIPVFVGYTQKIADSAEESIVQQPIRISSMAEYINIYGAPYTESFVVNNMGYLLPQGGADNMKVLPDFILYQSVQHFFANGGGACYIVSVGSFEADNAPNNRHKGDFKAALEVIKHVDEITLLVLTDAVSLGPVDYYSLTSKAIAQCSKLQDRFTLIDVLKSPNDSLETDIATMRDSVVGDIKYSATYAPYLRTVMSRAYRDENIKVKYTLVSLAADGSEQSVEIDTTLDQLNADGEGKDTATYYRVKAQLNKNYLVLPPSAAVAGIYAKTDASRGVWKAPANVAVSDVLGPLITIDNDMQESMNVDTTSGKSVNAIRAFTGKGTLVWGARTLAGNDNEWRYISVRRLFNMVEESIQKATHFAVFEPNTPFTWLKLKTMIESYLETLWRQGAFFGDSPAQAFFVNVGLGQTMTEDDINNGIMNIQIGLAAVRPAEFIILTFSHKRLEG